MGYPKEDYNRYLHGVFKYIPETGNKYAATEKGYVISFHHKTPKIIKGKIGRDGYREVQLYINHRKKYVKVAKLILLTFEKKRPRDLVICHNNGDPSDDSLKNLRYDTQRNNLLDRIEHGTLNQGEKSLNSKLKEYQVIYILNSKESTGKLAKKFNISKSSICDIKYGRTWKYLSKNYIKGE